MTQKHVPFAGGAAGYRLCLCGCAVPEPRRQRLSLPAGQWSQTPGRVTHVHTEHGGERARAKKLLVWTHITSHFTSWRKASALEADGIYNAQRFQVPAQSRGPPRSRDSSVDYVQNLQGSLQKSLHPMTKWTLLFTCLRSEKPRSFCVSSASQ